MRAISVGWIRWYLRFEDKSESRHGFVAAFQNSGHLLCPFHCGILPAPDHGTIPQQDIRSDHVLAIKARGPQSHVGIPTEFMTPFRTCKRRLDDLAYRICRTTWSRSLEALIAKNFALHIKKIGGSVVRVAVRSEEGDPGAKGNNRNCQSDDHDRNFGSARGRVLR